MSRWSPSAWPPSPRPKARRPNAMPLTRGRRSRPSGAAAGSARRRGDPSTWLSRTSASAQQQSAQSKSVLLVHVQKLDRCAPFGRQLADGSIQRRREMLAPRVASRMKQRHDRTRFGVNRCDVWALLQVTSDATETKIGTVVRAAMLFADNVIDLMRQNRRVLRKVAVLARSLGASTNQFPNVA